MIINPGIKHRNHSNTYVITQNNVVFNKVVPSYQHRSLQAKQCQKGVEKNPR